MARWSTPHAAAVFRSHLSVWGRQRVHGRARRGASRMVGVTVRTRGCTVGGRPSKGESVCKRENEDSSGFRCSLSVTLPSTQTRTVHFEVVRLDGEPSHRLREPLDVGLPFLAGFDGGAVRDVVGCGCRRSYHGRRQNEAATAEVDTLAEENGHKL